MSQERWTQVDNYITGLLVAPAEALEAAISSSAAAGLPPISVSPPLGKLLYLIARAMRAERILEIGTLGGYSTIWMASALGPRGRLVTLELDAHHAAVARENFARAGLAHLIELVQGAALDTLPTVAGPFDLIFIDADKVNYPRYLEWAAQLARPGGVIIADNVVRDGAIVETQSSDAAVQSVRRFNELVAANPRLQATAIQTVGEKGYDGFAMIVVGG